ncbi:MAG: DNA repair protein RecO [Endomicrobia bacterium]|nr:DNA repair protein RecO [Endomicrobiia bacterium]
MNYELVNGFILYRKNIMEYDKTITLYTLQHGKIKVLFKGVNKLTAKFISSIEPATETELQVVRLKSPNYETIFKFAGGTVVNFNHQLRTNLKIYLYTCKIIDLIDALTLEFAKDEDKFFLMKKIFQILPFSENCEVLYFAFVYRFIKLCGYMPELNKCVKCRQSLSINTNFYIFDFKNKGILCNKCINNNENNTERMKISFNSTNLLRKFYKLNAEQINNFKVEKSVLEEIIQLTSIYLQYYLHRPLRINLGSLIL